MMTSNNFKLIKSGTFKMGSNAKNYNNVPIDDSAYKEKVLHEMRIIRSGSWCDPAQFSGSAYRNGKNQNTRSDTIS